MSIVQSHSPRRSTYSAWTARKLREAYDMGYSLGLEGIPANPSLWYGPEEVKAFDRGHNDGFRVWESWFTGDDALPLDSEVYSGADQWPGWTDAIVAVPR